MNATTPAPEVHPPVHAHTHTHDRYVVPSSSTQGLAYMVMVDPETRLYRCSCPDHQFRARDCKHIRAVQAIQKTVDLPAMAGAAGVAGAA
jgi:hypothetical protein